MSEPLLHCGVEGTPGVVNEIFQVEGGPLSVYIAGPDGAPAVVLLHGAMYDEARFIWDQLFPVLAERFRVYALDTPRHGASRPWPGHLGHDRLLGILDAAFRHLGLDRFSLVGLSMGGGLALAYAAAHPDRVERLVLFEPGGLAERLDRQLLTWLYLKTPGTRRALDWYYARLSLPRVRKLLDQLYVGGSRPTDPDRLTGILKAEIDGKNRYRESDLDDWQAEVIGPRRLRWNLLGCAEQLRRPSLWLRGADSTLVKQDEMERAVALADKPGASASLVVVPGAGHMLPLERPAEANAEVLRFLTTTAE